MNIVLAADMHLKPGDNPEQNRRLSAFLNECNEYNQLVLIGDTFNCWFEKNGKYVGDYSEVINIFSKAISNGLEINFVSGNRDFALSKGRNKLTNEIKTGFTIPECKNYSVLADVGFNIKGWTYEFESKGVKYHCSHGDLYCIDDVWHQLLRYLIMGNPARIISSVVPCYFVNAIFKLFSAYDRNARKNTYQIYDYLLMKDEALIPIIDTGVDHIICGHLHQYMTRRIQGESNLGVLTVLPCWVGGEYGVIKDSSIVIKNVSYG